MLWDSFQYGSLRMTCLSSDTSVEAQPHGNNYLANWNMQRECWSTWSLAPKNKSTPNTESKLTTLTSEIVLHSQSTVTDWNSQRNVGLSGPYTTPKNKQHPIQRQADYLDIRDCTAFTINSYRLYLTNRTLICLIPVTPKISNNKYTGKLSTLTSETILHIWLLTGTCRVTFTHLIPKKSTKI